jgi:hypothetical protein
MIYARITELIIAIDPPRLERLYNESPEFHASVEVISRILPVLVGLLADDAANIAEQRRHAILSSELRGTGEILQQ